MISVLGITIPQTPLAAPPSNSVLDLYDGGKKGVLERRASLFRRELSRRYQDPVARAAMEERHPDLEDYLRRVDNGEENLDVDVINCMLFVFQIEPDQYVGDPIGLRNSDVRAFWQEKMKQEQITITNDPLRRIDLNTYVYCITLWELDNC